MTRPCSARVRPSRAPVLPVDCSVAACTVSCLSLSNCNHTAGSSVIDAESGVTVISTALDEPELATVSDVCHMTVRCMQVHVIAAGPELEIVFERVPSEEQKRRAARLQLPDAFYLFETYPTPCPGCAGCDQDSDRALRLTFFPLQQTHVA